MCLLLLLIIIIIIITSPSQGCATGEGAQKAPKKLLVHLMWQEDWTTNPWSSSKCVKGKIVYQKMAGAAQYFARQYEIHNDAVLISHHEEKAWSSTLCLRPPVLGQLRKGTDGVSTNGVTAFVCVF